MKKSALNENGDEKKIFSKETKLAD